MKIQADYSNINRYKNNYVTPANKREVSFEGLNLGRIFSRSSQVPEQVSREYTYQIASFLGLGIEELAPRIKGLNSQRRDFLRTLSRKYSDLNFNLGGKLKEDPALVFNVMRHVEKPNDYHYEVLSGSSGNFEYISRIFASAQDKKSLQFVLDFQQQILKNNPSCKNMLIDMLNSPFKKQYMKNINDYQSYIMLNKKNPEAIKELDLLMQNNQYDKSVYDIRLTVERVLGSQSLLSGKYLSKDNAEKYYTKHGIRFLDKFISSYRSGDLVLPQESEIQLFEMYKSTNKQNVDTRIDLVKKFRYEFKRDKNGINDEIVTMRKLFELMDSDKHAMNFVDKVSTTSCVKFDSIQQLYDVIRELTPQKADIFSDNVFRIVRRADGDELIPALKKHYNNPFFETKTSRYNQEKMVRYRFKQPESGFSKFKRAVLNKINEYRLAREEKRIAQNSAKIKSEETVIEKPQEVISEVKQPVTVEKPIISETKQPVTAEKPIIPETKQPVTTEKPQGKINVLPFEWNTQKALPLQPEILRLEHIVPTENSSVTLVNTVKESPKMRKLRLIGEVNELISKRLGAKTVEKQGEIYGKNATKMRLKMLPEIFDSIKETRQTDRAVGKLRSSSSNKDAVELYRLINGSNRKYVKYLLEKRNVDGTRMFEVKDIIGMVEKANKRVDAMKQANPDFKSKDAKAYFDHLYDSKIEQYGKVKRPKKKLTL